jgi:hypothetical protein
MVHHTGAAKNAMYLLSAGAKIHIAAWAIAIVGAVAGIVAYGEAATQIALYSSLLFIVISVLTVRAGIQEAETLGVNSEITPIASDIVTFSVVAFVAFIAGGVALLLPLGFLSTLLGWGLFFTGIGATFFALVQAIRVSKLSLQ